MTDKSHAFNALLPLLGSNQDSPDPESVEFGHFAYDVDQPRPRIAPELRRLTHGNPHGLPHRQFAAEVWKVVVAAANGRCAYCGCIADKLVREHMVPTAMGGGDEIENVVAACGRCNTRKGSRTPLVWFLLRDDIDAGRFRSKGAYHAAPCEWCNGNLFKGYTDTRDLHLRVLERCENCNDRRLVSLGAGQ